MDLITTNLESTFHALRNRDPIKVARQSVERHPDYKRIPTNNYSPVTSVNTGSWGNGMARFAAGNTGIIYGQPQFFSPVHTPMNWQIPSKRLEQYQWLFLPNTQVLTEDFTFSILENTEFDCENIIDDEVTGGFIFETKNYPKIMNSEGKFSQPPRMSMRDCKDKRCFSFKAIGNHNVVRISEEHYIFVLDGNVLRKNKKTICNKKYRAKNGIVPNVVEKVKIEDKLIKRIQAQDVKRSDYLLTPVPQIGSISMDNDLAWAIGFCVADGHIRTNNGYDVSFTGCKDEIALTNCKKVLESKFNGTISSRKHGEGKGWRVKIATKEAHSFFRKFIVNKGIQKKFSKEVFDLDIESRLNILAGYFDGDGCLEKPNGKNGVGRLIANCYSKDLADQIYWLLISCGITCSIGKYPLYGEHYETSSDCCYRILIPSSQVGPIIPYMQGDKIPNDFVPKKERELKFFYKEDGVTYFAQPIDKIEEFLYSGKGYDIEMTNDRHALVADGYVCSNSRFFYENEPKVASAIDFYSQFPMSNWEHECKNRDVKSYFDKFKQRLQLPKWTRMLSHEIHLLGDCFPFIEVECSHCNGTGKIGDELCDHEGGTLRRIIVLNPDFVEVHTTPLNPDPVIALRPDEELINMVQKRMPGFEKLSPEVVRLITTGQPILLDNRNVSHLKYGECGYQKFGIGMVRRLFPILSYKTKLMVAQWIVAERLIVPIKVVKVGDAERPAGPADIAAVQAQLANTSNDPNLTIVTHHAFDLEYYGASGKVLTLSNEFEFINQEILDGMMINNALLNGEGPNFTHCSKTRLLTNHGLKYCDEFDIENDLVATFNIHTKALEYQKATQKFEYQWDSVNGDDPKMKRFLTNRIDMLVTPNHRMLCAERKLTTKEGEGGQRVNGQREGFGDWGCVRANDVKKRSKFRACVDAWDATVQDNGTYCGLTTRDFLTIIGWYVSEGYRNKWIRKDGSESISKVSFSQSESANKLAHAKMTELLKKNGIYYVTESCKNVFYLRKVDNEALVQYLSSNCGGYANTKCIPHDIKNMSKDNLKILLDALVEGDGSERPATKKKLTTKQYYSYTTVSRQLRDDVIEILFKLGYSPRFNTITFDSDNLQTQYTISWGETNLGKFPVLDSRKWDNDNQKCSSKSEAVISDEDYIGKVWCVEVPNHFIITERNGLFGIHGNSSAAVGIEAMIQRLGTFRSQITEWLEEFIYLPEAKRQGFKDVNPETGEEEWLIPKIKWNSMHLRDQRDYRNFVIQLYEKGLLSAQTVLESFDFDPDQEIERKRYDALQMVAAGQGFGQSGMGGGGGPGGGGGGGMPPLGGGGEGGMGGGGPPIAPGGGGMGGGAEAPTGMGGGAAMAQSIPQVTAQVADPSQFGGKVLKKRTRERVQSEQQKMYRAKSQHDEKFGVMGKDGMQRDEKGRIMFTSAERNLIPHLTQAQQQGLMKDCMIYPQFRVSSGTTEYQIDFAIPNLKIGIEADGEIFHSAPKQKMHDQERDMKLQQQGWTIVRYTDTEIEKDAQAVIQDIVKTVMQKQMWLQQQVEGTKQNDKA